MSYREAARKLAALGCIEVARNGGGAHRKWASPSRILITVVPDHGGKDLKTGTLRAVVKQLGLNWAEFAKA